EAGVNALRFPQLYGALRWTPTFFEVTNAGAKAFGGDARFSYAIRPLGSPTRPAARFESTVTGLDLAQFTDFQELRGQRFAGATTWHNVLEWPLGSFSAHRGEGHVVVTPPPGVVTMAPSLNGARAADLDHSAHEWGPFAPMPLPRHLPISAELIYRYATEIISVESGTFA